MTEIIKTCRWKNVVKNDLVKRAEGKINVTLREDEPCYTCDGSRKTAEKIGCKNYIEGYK